MLASFLPAHSFLTPQIINWSLVHPHAQRSASGFQATKSPNSSSLAAYPHCKAHPRFQQSEQSSGELARKQKMGNSQPPDHQSSRSPETFPSCWSKQDPPPQKHNTIEKEKKAVNASTMPTPPDRAFLALSTSILVERWYPVWKWPWSSETHRYNPCSHFSWSQSLNK